MERFVCWDPNDIRSLENLDADVLDDAFFQAVHTDFAVQMRKGKNVETRSSISPTELIDEVLNQKTHAIVPIIGPAGSGKSHLVRWLSLRLKSRVPNSEVIYVPKAKTNLREILLLLVQRLPPSEQKLYRSALEAAGDGHLSKTAQRVAILANMQISLANDQLVGEGETDLDRERHCIDGLKHLMADPYLHTQLVRDGGFVHHIATHVFDPPDRAHYQQPTERREFQLSDLPIRGGNLQHAAASTRSFILDLTGDPDLQSVCVRIINRQLDWVITNCLNISGDRLVQLMTDLRAHFVKSGREQIFLFIEDFARLQGVDRALMQSLIVPKPGVLRTVFACTSGFFDGLRDTVISRTEFVVELGAPVSSINSDVVSFASKYMNAIRWGQASLDEQFKSAVRAKGEFVVGNRCDTCDHRDNCHASFGSSSGVGLYPFNEVAIQTMALRSGAIADNGFIPRDFLRGALRPVLERAVDIVSGRFPTENLYEHLGQTRISSASVEKLRKADPLSWKRRRTLLEFWGGSDAVVNLAPGVHAAFQMPMLCDVDPVPKPPNPTDPVLEEVAEIELWAAGQVISASTVTKLRVQIFNTLAEYIDWDDVGLSPTPFLDNNTGLFKQAQITFPRAATEQSPNPFRLMIEASDADEVGRTQLVLGLQGLLESEKAGHWGFPNGLAKLSALCELLEGWAADLLVRFRDVDKNPTASDATRDAFTLLAVRQLALAETVGPLTEEAVLAIAFSESPPREANFASAEMTKIMSAISQKAPDLLNALKTRLSLMKGARTGMYVDATGIRDLLIDLASGDIHVPEHWSEVGGDQTFVRRLAREVSKAWPSALEAEQKDHAAFRDTLSGYLGDASTVSDVNALTTTIVECGRQLEVAGVREFYDRWRDGPPSWDQIREAVLKSGPGTVGLLNRQIGREMKASMQFLEGLTKVIDRIEAAIDVRLKDLGIDLTAKEELVGDLKTALAQISRSLSVVGSDDPA